MCQHYEQHYDCDCEGQGIQSRYGCAECDRESSIHRHYQTKAEQITDLENYLEGIKSEMQAVEERLTDLRK